MLFLYLHFRSGSSIQNNNWKLFIMLSEHTERHKFKE